MTIVPRLPRVTKVRQDPQSSSLPIPFHCFRLSLSLFGQFAKLPAHFWCGALPANELVRLVVSASPVDSASAPLPLALCVGCDHDHNG